MITQPLRARYIFAAGDSCRRGSLRMAEHFFCLTRRGDTALFQNDRLLRETIRLIAAVGHKNNSSRKVRKIFFKFQLHFVAQGAVECRKRLIQKDHFGRACKNPRKRRPLLLSPGKTARITVFQAFKLKPADEILYQRFFSGTGSFAGNGDVLPHRHVREQRVVLKQVACAALLRAHVDFSAAVKECPPVRDDFTAVRRFDARDHFERHAFTCAGGAENRDSAGAAAPFDLQVQALKLLLDVNGDRHGFRAPQKSDSSVQ